MSQKYPTRRERELLVHAQFYINKNQVFPDNGWLKQQLQLDDNGIWNLKHSLKEKGYFEEKFGFLTFTAKAIQCLKDLQHSAEIVVPLEIKVLGTVEAGRRERDEAAVIGLDEFNDDAPTITIPSVNLEASIFALQVNGQSMEDEHIFDGDYILVEKFNNNEQPKQNEMIVAMYLPLDVEPDSDWTEEWLDGPTVKYYFQIVENGELLYRLSPRKNIQESSYTIKTRSIQSIGRVVGVYRPISKG